MVNPLNMSDQLFRRTDINGASDAAVGNPTPPPIRGAQRTALVRDLALGEHTYEQLAERYGRSHQAVKQFAARNVDEINEAKQEMSREDIEPWGTQKRDRLAVYSQQLVEVDDRLQSGELTPGQEVRFRSLLIKTLHQIAEERGELPTRSHLELDVKGNPFQFPTRWCRMPTGTFTR